MVWTNSQPSFCAASETVRDVAAQYIKSPVGTMPTNCFQHLTEVNPKFKAIPTNKVYDDPLQYFLKVSVDNYIDLEIGRIQEKLWHVSNLVMRGIYDVLPPNTDFIEYPISLKKVPKEEGAWDLIKEVLGFEFGGNPQ